MGLLSGEKALVFKTLIFLFLALWVWPLKAQGGLSAFRYYFGSLHNHSAYSDGTGTPDEAFRYARMKGKLDFFALTDHSHMLSRDKWLSVKALASRHDQNGLFVALHGFEWSHSHYGHVVVLGTREYCTESGAETKDFRGFLTWLKKNRGIAFLAHPGERNKAGKEFNAFRDPPVEEVVGMELWNKTRGFRVFYYNDGYFKNDGGKGFFDESLSRGWRLGAAGGEDNHDGTFGKKTDYRVGVIALSLTRENILKALRERRFYATADKNLKIFFSVSGHLMGAVIRPGFHSVVVEGEDGEGESFARVELVKNGVVIKSWFPNASRPVLTYKLECRSGDYLYVRVKQVDGDEAISSPVFVR